MIFTWTWGITDIIIGIYGSYLKLLSLQDLFGSVPEGKEDAALLLLDGDWIQVLHVAPMDILVRKGVSSLLEREGHLLMTLKNKGGGWVLHCQLLARPPLTHSSTEGRNTSILLGREVEIQHPHVDSRDTVGSKVGGLLTTGDHGSSECPLGLYYWEWGHIFSPFLFGVRQLQFQSFLFC